jgi:predicted nucleic acid-binding protein
MHEIACPTLTVDWDDLTQMQIKCLRNGINNVGIPDLMIAQHAIQNHLELYSHDKHFRLLAKHMPLTMH